MTTTSTTTSSGSSTTSTTSSSTTGATGTTSPTTGPTISTTRPVPPQEKITIRGSKTWNHRDNPAANQPKSINLILYIKADGVIVRQREITAAEHWSWSIQVDKYDENGREIVYTVDEKRIDNYAKKVSGYNLQNDYYPGWNTDMPYPDKPYTPGKPTNPPKTDDTANPALWLTLMAVSAAGLVILIVMKRRRTHGSKKKKRRR